MCAAAADFKPCALQLIESGSDPNATNKRGHTALYVAQFNRHREVQAFLEGKTLFDSHSSSLSEKKSETLIKAVRIGDLESVVKLLDPDLIKIKDASGATLLILAAIGGHVTIIRYLLNHFEGRKYIDVQDLVNGWTALMQATFYGHYESAGILLKGQFTPWIVKN